MRLFSLLQATLAITVFNLAAQAQPNSFTYQGSLSSNGSPASGKFDLQFAVYDALTSGTVAGGPITNLAASVSNGLFTVTLDFGAGVFSGANRWLQIGVRTNGAENFVSLSPRQALNSAPYAVYAGGVNAAGISGPIPANSIGNATITANMLATGAATANLAISGQSSVPGGAMLLSATPNATNLVAAGYIRSGAQLDLCWQQRSSEVARTDPVYAWTGTKLLVWGGSDRQANPLRSGGRFNPEADNWSAMAISNSPSARAWSAAVWTGRRMLVWGGLHSSTFYDDGASYDPTNNSWVLMATTNAPEKRASHTAVWTGSEMIVWGGRTSEGQGFGVYDLNTGARYNPASGTWTPISINGAPSPRFNHIAIWTGSEMIVWGGCVEEVSDLRLLGDGARYHPATDSWSTVATNGAPAARFGHTSLWIGQELLIWGGQIKDGATFTTSNDGYRYTPATDTWTPITAQDAPGARANHTAIWTGEEMIVWGGNNTSELDTGGRYNPTSDQWLPITTTSAPGTRRGHVAVWTGTEMLIAAGYASPATYWNDTYSYTPSRIMYLYLRP